jgi:hypothetical protein
MDADRVLSESERGIHLLFDNATIAEAFAQDPAALQRALKALGASVESVVEALLRQPTALAGRAFIEGLAPELRHVLVLLYFELLDGRLRRSRVLH